MAERPIRVQLSRAKGWRMPPNTVSVARPSQWGNPFRIGAEGIPDAETAVARYALWISEWLPLYPDMLEPLRGKNLACFCKPGEPCHADVLLELANREEEGGNA